MTKFQGPLQIGTHGAPGTEVAYATIGASGTASFAAGVSAAGPIDVASGTVELIQKVTVVDQTSVGNPVAINLPLGSDITSIEFLVEVVFTASASAQTGELVVYLGGGDATALSIISETRVSATGAHNCLSLAGATSNLEMSRLRNITSTVHAFLTAKNVATVFTGGGQGMLHVRYLQN